MVVEPPTISLPNACAYPGPMLAQKSHYPRLEGEGLSRACRLKADSYGARKPPPLGGGGSAFGPSTMLKLSPKGEGFNPPKIRIMKSPCASCQPPYAKVHHSLEFIDIIINGALTHVKIDTTRFP